jgi:hypothetical protein
MKFTKKEVKYGLRLSAVIGGSLVVSNLIAGRSLLDAILWGIGTTLAALLVLWLTTLSSAKRKPDDPNIS